MASLVAAPQIDYIEIGLKDGRRFRGSGADVLYHEIAQSNDFHAPPLMVTRRNDTIWTITLSVDQLSVSMEPDLIEESTQ